MSATCIWDINNLHQSVSIKTLMAIPVMIMGVLSLILVVGALSVYRDQAFASHRQTLSRLVALKVADNLEDHFQTTVEMGLSVQRDPHLRLALTEHRLEDIVERLDSQFHQYFTTADIIKLHKLFVTDRNFRLLAHASEGIAEADIEATALLCSQFMQHIRRRTGAERLKPYGDLCNSGNLVSFNTIVPIGTLRPLGYLIIASDPLPALQNTDSALGIPVRIQTLEGKPLRQSTHWPDDSRHTSEGIGRYTVTDQAGQAVVQVLAYGDLTTLQTQLGRTRTIASLLILFVVLPLVAFSMNILNRALRPLQQLRQAAGKLANGELSSVPASRFREIQATIQPFNDMAAQISRLIGRLEAEISVRKLAEKHMREHRSRLEQTVKERTAELEKTHSQALAASRAKSTFLANVTHELRTPLNAIIGYSEILAEDAAALGYERIVDDARKISTAGNQLLALISDILDLSKIESGKVELHIEEFDLAALIEEIATTFQPLVAKNTNTLALHLDDHLGTLCSDPTKLRQILVNLLANANKFTECGHITLSARRIDNARRVEFSVSDTGIGIEPQAQPRLFDSFTQADGTITRRYGGTGLGLAISQRLCQLLGGQIHVQSVPGEGSTFTFSINAHLEETGDSLRPETETAG